VPLAANGFRPAASPGHHNGPQVGRGRRLGCEIYANPPRPEPSQLHSQRNVGPTSQQKGTEPNHRIVTEEFPNVSTRTSEHPRAPTRSKSVTSTSVIIGLTPHRRLVNSRGHNYSTARSVSSGTDATDYSRGSGAIPRAFSVGP
jgi:hypothetical protein